MPAVTAAQLVNDALGYLNVIPAGSTAPAPQAAFGFRHLNYLMSSWAQRKLTIPVIAREEFTLLAGKGTPSNPYTWGIGGNLNTSKPPAMGSLNNAALSLNVSSPAVEVPLAILTNDSYQSIQIKELTNSQPTCVFYNPTFQTTGFGALFLWPIPTNLVNTLILYRYQQLAQFADQSTSYQLPDGYDAAIMFSLVKWLANAMGRNIMPETADLVRETFAVILSSNIVLSDVPNDLGFLGGGIGNLSAGYNILTGTGG